MNRYDNAENEQTTEDRAFDHVVRKLKAKQYPTVRNHVTEMRKHTDYTEHFNSNQDLIKVINSTEKWNYSI